MFFFVSGKKQMTYSSFEILCCHCRARGSIELHAEQVHWGGSGCKECPGLHTTHEGSSAGSHKVCQTPIVRWYVHSTLNYIHHRISCTDTEICKINRRGKMYCSVIHYWILTYLKTLLSTKEMPKK
jgi:hypothetical protein